MNYKKFITPRDAAYKAKPFIFDRFNYQNYQNYQYKNPYKPSKMGQQDRIMKPAKKNIKKGTQKNIQIVFCQQKLQTFVKKSNTQIKDFYQLKKRQSFSNLPFYKNSSTSTSIIKSRSFTSVKKVNMKQNILQKRNRRATLSNYLQQFNTLQKLSVYMQREHKLNEKFLFNSFADSSRTVLLDIVVHRFAFLKRLKKRIKQLVFKVLLNLEQVPQFYKINIHQYLKFIQLFVSRDADSQIVTMFMLSFFFKEAKNISFQIAKDVLDQVGGLASKHGIVQEKLFKILDESKNDGEKLYYSIKDDLLLQYIFIDLILGKQ